MERDGDRYVAARLGQTGYLAQQPGRRIAGGGDLGEPGGGRGLGQSAVKTVLKGGLRTADIMAAGKAKVSTTVMGEAIVRELDKLS